MDINQSSQTSVQDKSEHNQIVTNTQTNIHNNDVLSENSGYEYNMQLFTDINEKIDIPILQKQCNDFKHIIEFLENNILPDNAKQAKDLPYISSQYEFIDNTLYHIFQPRTHKKINECRYIKQLALPTKLRQEVLYGLHDNSGHYGIDRTY